jgi:hypothetical protein
MGFMNGVFALLGRSFRAFLHAPSSIYAAAQNEGLSVAATSRGLVWEFTAFRRGV